MRGMIAAIAAFVISAAVGRVLIPALRALHAGQSIKEIGPFWHKSKEGTPTMGGIMFISATLIALLVLTVPEMAAGDFSGLFVLAFALCYGAIGFLDDLAKLRHKENTGLSAKWKFLLQLALAAVFTAVMLQSGHVVPALYVPFFNVSLSLPLPAYLLFAAFVMVGCDNAVNLTDGLDGLAASVTLPVMAFFACLAAYWNRPALAVFAAALAGGLVGFLVYNFHPAKVFMGDTGSLFLGGAVCGLAFALDVPLVLIPIGIIYIAETLSDIIQVVYFKATHGKRFFRMAPLHHHFELGGWPEVKIVLVFAGITVAGCVLAWFGVMGRGV